MRKILDTIKKNIQTRKEINEFERVLADASPAMRSELLAAAHRSNYLI